MATMESTLSLGVLVPGAEAGRLIGKQGSGLKQIREMSQCQVQLGQNQDSGGNRKCDISGPTVEHMASAIHAVGTRLFEKVSPQERVVLMVVFPSEYVGPVIGRGGQNLRNITEQTGVEIQLRKDAVTDQGERIGQLTGIRDQLGAAVRIALNAVSGGTSQMMNDHPEYNSYQGQPMQGMQSGAWRPQPRGNSGGGPIGGMPQMGGKGMGGKGMGGKGMGHMAAPMGGGLTQVRHASGTPGEMQVHMVIPSKFIGCILGKEGSQIKQLQTETGCTTLAVSKKEPYSDADRRVIIVGGFDECARAQQQVWQLYSENAQQGGAEATLSCIMMVPVDKAGAVIGKEGSNLKQMREKLSIRAQLSKEQVEGFRPCTLGGTLEAVLEAERQILEQISDSSVGNGVKRELEAEGLVPATAYVRGAYAGEPEAKKQKVTAGAGDDAYTKLLVPGTAAGAIIGKQGSTLKSIREGTGARVEVLPSAQTPEFHDMRVVILKGEFDPRQAALVKVLTAAFEQNQTAAVLKMMVPKQLVGALIGKAACNLKAIRENSGINVQVDKQEFNGERMVHAEGALDAILNAATLILGSCEGTPSSVALSS